jgi:uncharacterized protein
MPRVATRPESQAPRPDPALPAPDIRHAPEAPLEGRISATTLYTLSKCERRLYLWQHAREEAAPPSDYDRLIMERGRDHERRVRERFPGAIGPVWSYGQPEAPAAAETRRLLRETRAPLYQAMLLSADGRLAGVPDFLYWEGDALVIHEAKLALRADPKEHPEIGMQMAHYANLVEQFAGNRVARLEMTNGQGEVVEVPAPLPEEYESTVRRAAELIGDAPEPELLMAHSTCEDCPFYDHCWPRAIAERRVEILPDVTRRAQPRLLQLGIRTVDRLAAADPDELRGPGILTSAEAMVAEAIAHREQRAVWLGPARLPARRPIVWFDLEGDADGEETQAPIYLWGLAVDDGTHEPRAESILADFEEGGDRAGWVRFVARAEKIFARHPEALWVHYASYERDWVKKYLERYGAPAGFRERIEGALFDLLRGFIKKHLRLPLYSYSIKRVAPWIGYRWRNPESGSIWSVLQYYRARATQDPAERRRILDEIVRYNEDDLWAMRAVWKWLESQQRGSGA